MPTFAVSLLPSLYTGVNDSSASIIESWLMAQALNPLIGQDKCQTTTPSYSLGIKKHSKRLLPPYYLGQDKYQTTTPALASCSPLAAGGIAETAGALGGLVAGGAACSAWSAVCFLRERRHHLRLDLPSGAAMPAYLRGEACGSAKDGLFCGAVIGAGYL